MEDKHGLVLKRNLDQGIYIGDAFIKVKHIGKNTVKLLISAPPDVKILREELKKS